ncbi:MAG: DUF4129 domain-containing protein [Chloroflexota bacterium]
MAQARITPSPVFTEARLKQIMLAWKYVHHEMLALCYVIMDAALLTPLALGIMQWARFWPPASFFLWIGCLMLFAFNYSRLLAKLGLNEDQMPLLTAVALLTTIYLSIRAIVYSPDSFFDPSWLRVLLQDLTTSGGIRWPQALGILFLVLIAWMRGLRLATREVDINMIGLRLRLGGLILSPLIVWFGHSRLIWDVSPYLLLFLLAGLTAISLTRAEEIEKGQSGHSAALNPKWLSMILIAAGGIIVIATLIAALLSGDSLPTIVGWLTPLVIAIQFLLAIAGLTAIDLFLPIWQIIERSLTLLVNFLVSTFGIFRLLTKIAAKLERFNTNPEETATGAPPELPPPTFGQFSLDLSYFQQYSNLLGLLLIIAFILIVALTVSMSRRTVTFDEGNSDRVDRDSKDNSGEGLLDKLLSRIDAWRDWRTAVSIRRIYRHMCRAAEANGFPRLTTETPYEYLNTLAQTWPENLKETRIITQAYVKIRYGELPENKKELQTIISAWETLEQTKPIENIAELDE